MRFTKIVCTLGPSSETLETLRAMADGGMTIARINLSHGTHDDHRPRMELVRTVNAERRAKGLPEVAIMIDTQGAEIRTGVTDKPFVIEKGQEILFSSDPKRTSTMTVIMVNYPDFGADVPKTDRILIDNGELVFDIVRVEKNGDVVARARESGKIGSRRHVNLPGADISLPSITERDWDDLQFGVDEKVDFVALSFIRTAKDVESVRKFLNDRRSKMQIISKIETKQSVDKIQEIIAASDGVMVARGDLGAELPFESLPVIQDQIVHHCRTLGVPVIVATHMLESMIQQPTPTRAEVTDIAHAATTRADATMLSGETAAGKHPLLALDAMDRVLRATEEHLRRFRLMQHAAVQNEHEARAQAAVTLAASTDAMAILAFTRSGQTARVLSKFRPHIPIITFATDAPVLRRLQIFYGVLPLEMRLDDDPEVSVRGAMKRCIESKLLKPGEKIVVVSDAKAHDQIINTVQLRVIG